jgi:hypothetical protein
VANVVPSAETSESDLKEELRGRLLRTIGVRDLADEITCLLKARGRKPGTQETVAVYLASELISKFAQPNREVERLIENRSRQVDAMLGEIVWEEVQQFIKANPKILQAKARRAKIATDEERTKRTKEAKNRYEHRRRIRYIGRGSVEQQFGETSPFSLAGLLEQLPPWGPCLDNIFRGGRVKMCDVMDSLQSLFGLSRKKLAAAPKIRRGRETFYDYRAVLHCMDTLLKQSGERAAWLPDPERRRTVLAGILFRAKQEAEPKIADAFAKTLLPYLN